MRGGQWGLLLGLGLLVAVVGFLTGTLLLGPESRLAVAVVGALVGLGLARALWVTRPAAPAPPVERTDSNAPSTDATSAARARPATRRARQRREREERGRRERDGGE